MGPLNSMKSTSVLFVCLGNICRSPTADGIFRAMVEKEGLGHVISVDSAGTSDWHVGKQPDPRTVEAAERRGYDLSPLRGRQVSPEDFDNFDFILAMDNDNLADLKQMMPKHFAGHLGLALAFADRSRRKQEGDDVPDPYYGGNRGFDLVLDLLEDACSGLLSHIKTRT